MRSRRGVSLVELLVVMSLSSLLLTTSAVVLHRVMHAQIKTTDFLSASRNGQRLADLFRRDVHRARMVMTDGLADGTIVRLRMSEMQTVEYRQDQGVIRRALLDGDETVARDEFTFPVHSQIEVIQQMSPPLVSLAISSTPGTDSSSGQQSFATAVHLRVVAEPGRERRFTDVPAEQEKSP